MNNSLLNIGSLLIPKNMIKTFAIIIKSYGDKMYLIKWTMTGSFSVLSESFIIKSFEIYE